MINIIIGDDDAIICEGLKMIIESQDDMKLIGVANDGQQAVEMCRNNKVDVVVLDIRMPIMDGISASELIISEKLATPLFLTTFDEDELIIKAIKVGVSGYILKNSTSQRILSAIRSVAVGGVVFQNDILEFIQKHIEFNNHNDNSFLDLSDREMQIVKLIAKGHSNIQIANMLYLTNGTVRNYISVILEKMGLEHRTQIAVTYLTRN